MKSATFRVQTWGITVHLLWEVSPKQFRNYVRKELRPGYSNPGEFHGICYSRSDNINDIVIGLEAWHGKPFDYAVLSHECCHAAMRILRDRGVRIRKSTEEVFCYLQDSIFARCLEGIYACRN